MLGQEFKRQRSFREVSILILISIMTLCSCVTPIEVRKLTRKEIIKLTTCRTSPRKIANNLKLLGYSVKVAKDKVITTNFIQVSGSSDDKKMRRVIVTPQSRSTSRFKIRLKNEETETYKDDSRTLSFRSLSFGDTGTSKTKVKTSEEDMEYWSNRVDEYKDMQKDVCG
jgi:DNA-binding Lrp family transcriptional regulator